MNITKLLEKWPLDAWSIGPKTFQKITEILPHGSTLLEFGSGAGTNLLANFYKMKSIENDSAYINRYNSIYFNVPLCSAGTKYIAFPGDPYWFDEGILRSQIPVIGQYDALLIDGPKGFRGGLYYNHSLFDFKNTIVIFDDVHCDDHHKLMTMIAADVNRTFSVYDDINGKKFGVLDP
jgi:hypothetical protein